MKLTPRRIASAVRARRTFRANSPLTVAFHIPVTAPFAGPILTAPASTPEARPRSGADVTLRTRKLGFCCQNAQVLGRSAPMFSQALTLTSGETEDAREAIPEQAGGDGGDD